MPAPWVLKLSRAHRRRVLLGATPTWWETACPITPWALYQPKGAASLAASYTDLSGSGNHTALGIAPTWDATNGWKFDGLTQHLRTTFLPAQDQSQTVLVQYTATGASYVVGAAPTGGQLYIKALEGGGVRYANGADSTLVFPNMAAGNLAIAGNRGYRNGIAEGAALSAWSSQTNDAIYIGCRSYNGSASNHTACHIQAFALYDVTLTAAQVLALATAMSAL